MDDIQQDYMDAYRKYNHKPIKITKHTQIRYFIKGQPKGYTAGQIRGFTQTLRARLEP